MFAGGQAAVGVLTRGRGGATKKVARTRRPNAVYTTVKTQGAASKNSNSCNQLAMKSPW